MLQNLWIKNVALIAELDLPLPMGAIMLTGETGAGKSIVLDSLNLLLGARADSTLVRHGAQYAEVVGTFDVQAHLAARNCLEANGLLDDDAPHIGLVRRVIYADGRSKSFINGTPVPIKQLRELGEHLLVIHGQNSQHALLRAEAQRDLLDEYMNEPSVLHAVREAYLSWKNTDKKIENLKNTLSQNTNLQLDFLNYQLEELVKNNIQNQEWEMLEKNQKILANSDKILHQGQGILAQLSESDENIQSQLRKITQVLNQLSSQDSRFANAAQMLNEASVLCSESADELASLIENTAQDPEKLAHIEQRMSLLYDLARKHQISPAELPEYTQKLQLKLTTLGEYENTLNALLTERENHKKTWEKHADLLHDARKKSAAILSQNVTNFIQNLGMPNGKFHIEVTRDDQSEPKSTGNDKVLMQIQANLGQPPAPLHKAASGGELSRVSLALQMATIALNGVPTLIFDEVDAGISGAVAETVGKLLGELGKTRQVLCVTHLPQVAAQGQHHFFVAKQTLGNNTFTNVKILDKNGRIEAIARLLGGANLTDSTRQMAQELLENVT